MKRLSAYRLLLLSVLYHTFTDADGQYETLFVRIGENATIKCSVSNPDQDGVYVYVEKPQGKKETLLYYYKDGTFTTESPFKERVTTNREFGDFSVCLSNVKEDDQGDYWCKFNKLDKNTESGRTSLVIQPRNLMNALIPSDADSGCETLFVRIGENAIIKCSVSNPDQDGVYVYVEKPQGKVEQVLYYYKDGTFTTEKPFEGRVTINRKFGDFSVFLSNVRADDHGVYWCTFNKLEKNTESERTFLVIQSSNLNCPLIQTSKQMNPPSETENKVLYVSKVYLFVICVQSALILLLVVILVKLYLDRGNYTPKHQSSNGVYEVMRGNTTKALLNSAYVSRQKLMQPNSARV